MFWWQQPLKRGVVRQRAGRSRFFEGAQARARRREVGPRYGVVVVEFRVISWRRFILLMLIVRASRGFRTDGPSIWVVFQGRGM